MTSSAATRGISRLAKPSRMLVAVRTASTHPANGPWLCRRKRLPNADLRERIAVLPKDVTLTVQPSLLTKDGEVVPLELSPISADDAGLLLPQVRAVLQQVRRYEGFLADVIKSEMVSRGQRERRAGETVYELKGEAEWVVDDSGALFRVLVEARARGEVTPEEHEKAHQQVVTHHWNNSALNVLAKRVPEIDQHRHRTEGEPRLRTK